MAAAIESEKTGGKFGHMYVILKEEEYRKATNNNTATVTMLKKPPDVNPKFKDVEKKDLTRFVSMEGEELCTIYGPSEWMDTLGRRQFLYDRFHFTCIVICVQRGILQVGMNGWNRYVFCKRILHYHHH
jgi:hypothetical protein